MKTKKLTYERVYKESMVRAFGLDEADMKEASPIVKKIKRALKKQAERIERSRQELEKQLNQSLELPPGVRFKLVPVRLEKKR